ncbi:chain length determinant protein EpsF [Ideonella sp. DXS22W]|uniref:Chain length determinant protein EpsF n=1 Tax=Pseudaquabacterium inlustre TaxID=2984192 RepID=A0ABU9CHT0_9BURK
MTFGQFLSILRARKWAALLVFALVVATTVAVSLLLPKQYKADASVVIDVKPDPITAMMNPTAAMPSFMATQIDILGSDRVALRVIKDLKLTDNAGLREQWQSEANGKGTFEQYLIDLLQKGLDVKPSRESNVITVSYKSPDPRFAAGLANAFAQAYIATTLELRADPAANFKKFFDTQTKDARDALEKAQGKLSAYQQAKGIIATDERLDVENARLNELSSQVTQLQAVSAESASRQSQAQGSQADRLQEVLNNPVIGGLKVELNRNEARLQELTQRLGDANPQVVEAKANIAELRARLDAETKRVTGGVGVSNTINKGREAQVRAALEAQRAKVLQLKAVRDEGMVLQREVENAQRIYDNLVVRLNQTGLEAQNTQSYANVLTMAQPPADHASPKLLLNTALAVFLGLLLAVGVALLLELSDRRVRAPEDAVAALGLPVLGTLPKPGAKRFNPARPALHSPQALSLPAPETGRSL